MGRGRDRGNAKRGRGGRGSYNIPGGRNVGSYGGGGMLRHVLTLEQNVVKSATKTSSYCGATPPGSQYRYKFNSSEYHGTSSPLARVLRMRSASVSLARL